MVLKNYYKILGLETSHVSAEEVKTAYRLAAKKYHPDLNVGDRLAEEKIKDINEAYRVLSTPSSKRKYDRVWNSKFGKNEKAFSNKNDKGAIFNIFLGEVKKAKSNTNVSKNMVKGENIETEIDTSIYEAFYGSDKKIAIRNVNGEAKNFSVTIPKGIQNGEKIRLIGQGKTGVAGGKNGDLLIKINIKDDKKFKLKGYDLYTELLLTPWEAALGTRTVIETIDDQTQIYIPQGIQTGEKIRVPGKGYIENKDKRGDLIAEVKVMVPKKLTQEEKAIFEKLNEISMFNPRK